MLLLTQLAVVGVVRVRIKLTLLFSLSPVYILWGLNNDLRIDWVSIPAWTPLIMIFHGVNLFSFWKDKQKWPFFVFFFLFSCYHVKTALFFCRAITLWSRVFPFSRIHRCAYVKIFTLQPSLLCIIAAVIRTSAIRTSSLSSAHCFFFLVLYSMPFRSKSYQLPKLGHRKDSWINETNTTRTLKWMDHRLCHSRITST